MLLVTSKSVLTNPSLHESENFLISSSQVRTVQPKESLVIKSEFSVCKTSKNTGIPNIETYKTDQLFSEDLQHHGLITLHLKWQSLDKIGRIFKIIENSLSHFKIDYIKKGARK